MIPRCKLWNVTYWLPDHTKRTWRGYAPTRQFALWNARDAMGWRDWHRASKVTASVVQKGQKRFRELTS